ncbi:putative nitric oxide synthase, brain isoform X1 [Apostichopus japonicus]|uniref:nitric-oxide synthase (NADPH) n=1 Tax=Stichopus japonicus TaxID=307972 RepID=A0A2G8K010_STIJA|nr:putative nitric oxide synthase, brain isoform X1 [Apostichopus japonicus]
MDISSVCGRLHGGDVQKALEEIISDQGKMSIDQAKEYVSKLRDHTRYHEDIFGVTLKTAEVRSKLRTAVRAHVLISAGGSKLTPAGEALQADQNENGQDGPNKELERSNSVKSLGDKEKRTSLEVDLLNPNMESKNKPRRPTRRSITATVLLSEEELEELRKSHEASQKE